MPLPGDLPPILHLLIIPHLYTSYHTCTHYTTLVNIIPHLYTLTALVHIIPHLYIVYCTCAMLACTCHIYFVHIMRRTCAHHSNELQISSALEQATLGKCTHAFFFPFLFVVDIQLILNSSSKFVVVKFTRQCTQCTDTALCENRAPALPMVKYEVSEGLQTFQSAVF